MMVVGHREHAAASQAKRTLPPRLFFESFRKSKTDLAQALYYGVRIVVHPRMRHVTPQAGSLSITLRRAGVGIILVRLNLPSPKSERNSASERCRPPVQPSMLTSLAAAPRATSDTSMRGG